MPTIYANTSDNDANSGIRSSFSAARDFNGTAFLGNASDGSETFAGMTPPYDISGVKFIIHNGGSGYKVGDKFSLTRINGSTNPMSGFMSAGNAVQCSVTSVASTKIEPGRN